jgi:hypothetical protein
VWFARGTDGKPSAERVAQRGAGREVIIAISPDIEPAPIQDLRSEERAPRPPRHGDPPAEPPPLPREPSLDSEDDAQLVEDIERSEDEGMTEPAVTPPDPDGHAVAEEDEAALEDDGLLGDA